MARNITTDTSLFFLFLGFNLLVNVMAQRAGLYSSFRLMVRPRITSGLQTWESYSNLVGKFTQHVRLTCSVYPLVVGGHQGLFSVTKRYEMMMEINEVKMRIQRCQQNYAGHPLSNGRGQKLS